MPTLSIRSCPLIVLLCTTSVMPGQVIEFFTDLHHAHYYDNEQGHYQSVITPELGYSIGMGIDSFKGFKAGLLLQFDHVSGYAEARNGGLGSGYGVNMEFSKSTLSAAIMPLKIRIAPTADIAFGMWFSVLLNESYRGDYTTWSAIEAPDTVEVNTVYESFSRKTNFGLASRLSFDAPISPSLTLSPHFTFIMGSGREFISLPDREKILRFHFGIGLKKSIGKKVAAAENPSGS